MSTATLSEFRQNQAQYIAAAQVEPVELRSRGAQTRAVLVSPAFYEEAMEALRLFAITSSTRTMSTHSTTSALTWG